MNNILWTVRRFEELTGAEVYAILQTRAAVFVVEQKIYYLDPDDYDQKALHLCGWQEEKLVAYCRIFGPGIKYAEASIGRVLSSEEVRGTGAGRALVYLAVQTIDTVFQTGNIRISAQDYLLPFYESFGFVATDKKYFEDTLPHTEMVRE